MSAAQGGDARGEWGGGGLGVSRRVFAQTAITALAAVLLPWRPQPRKGPPQEGLLARYTPMDCTYVPLKDTETGETLDSFEWPVPHSALHFKKRSTSYLPGNVLYYDRLSAEQANAVAAWAYSRKRGCTVFVNSIDGKAAPWVLHCREGAIV